MSKTVIIYASRTSFEDKNTISIDSQIKEIEKVCDEKGLKIEGIYKDNKLNFKDGTKSNFDEMLDEIKKRNIKLLGNKVDYLYIYQTSILAINRDAFNKIRDIFSDIKILSTRESYQDGLKGEKKLMDELSSLIYERYHKEKLNK